MFTLRNVLVVLYIDMTLGCRKLSLSVSAPVKIVTWCAERAPRGPTDTHIEPLTRVVKLKSDISRDFCG